MLPSEKTSVTVTTEDNGSRRIVRIHVNGKILANYDERDYASGLNARRTAEHNARIVAEALRLAGATVSASSHGYAL